MTLFVILFQFEHQLTSKSNEAFGRDKHIDQREFQLDRDFQFEMYATVKGIYYLCTNPSEMNETNQKRHLKNVFLQYNAESVEYNQLEKGNK